MPQREVGVNRNTDDRARDNSSILFFDSPTTECPYKQSKGDMNAQSY